MIGLFKDHPRSVGESYIQHFVHASSFGLTMLIGGIACLLHGIFPFLFERTGSQAIAALHDRMVVNRVRTSGMDSPMEPAE